MNPLPRNNPPEIAPLDASVALLKLAKPEFKDTVNKCAEHGTDQWISNRAMSHAAYLLDKLLEVSADKRLPLTMVAGRFDPRIYDQLVGRLDACMQAGVNITAILVELDGPGENAFLNKLKGYAKAELFRVDEGMREDIAHMTVVGDRAFRYEGPQPSYEAIANFGNEGGVRTLNTIVKKWRDDAALIRI